MTAGANVGMIATLRRLMLAAALALLAVPALAQSPTLAPAATPVTPAQPAGPAVCRIGAYLVDLSEIDTAHRTFRADVWLWSVCPRADLHPLQSVELVNADQATFSLDSTQQRGDQWWSLRKVQGVFRESFELASFPFDRHPLAIEIEDGGADARSLVFEADREHSTMNPQIDLPGWRIANFRVRSGIATEPTTLGDPSLAQGSSRHARMVLIVDAERAHWATFAKLTAGLYVAAILAWLTLFIDAADASMMSARLGVQIGAVFAVVVNLLSLNEIVGREAGLTLLDQVHLSALALIVLAAGVSVWSWSRIVAGRPHEIVRRWDRRAAIAFAVLFILANVEVVSMALIHGGENSITFALSRAVGAS